MPEDILVSSIRHLFRVDESGLEAAHDDVRVMLRLSAPKYDTAQYQTYWENARGIIDTVTAEECHRCESTIPPDKPGSSIGRRRMRQALEQIFKPQPVLEAERAHASESWERGRAKSEQLKEAFHASRAARGLPAQLTSGKPEPRANIVSLPEFDPWTDLAQVNANVDVAVNRMHAHRRQQNGPNLGGLPVAHSRIGGVPDLPPGVSWPTLRGKKIPFILQLKLADFPKVHHVLPADGHLLAFVLCHNEGDDWPPPTVVMLHRGSDKSLTRAEAPIDDNDVFLTAAENGIFDVLPAQAAETVPIGTPKTNRERLGHFFGKMPDDYGTPGECATYAMAEGEKWIVLLEIHSVGSMQWSDCGSLFLLITRDALARLDFSNVIAVCSS